MKNIRTNFPQFKFEFGGAELILPFVFSRIWPSSGCRAVTIKSLAVQWLEPCVPSACHDQAARRTRAILLIADHIDPRQSCGPYGICCGRVNHPVVSHRTSHSTARIHPPDVTTRYATAARQPQTCATHNAPRMRCTQADGEAGAHAMCTRCPRQVSSSRPSASIDAFVRGRSPLTNQTEHSPDQCRHPRSAWPQAH